MEVINLVSGKTRTWTGQSTPGYWPGVPAWASDDTVVVPWWHSAVGMNPDRPPGMIPAVMTGIRQIEAAEPAGNGQLIRVLRTQTTRFGNDVDATSAVTLQCEVFSVAGDGAHVLVQAFAFGRIDNGVFTPLSGASPLVRPVSAAW